MRSQTRILTPIVTVAAGIFALTVAGCGAVAGQSTASSTGDRTRFVGTYELVMTEDKDPATGKWSPTPNFNSNGYIIYADTGHMARADPAEGPDAFHGHSPERRRSAGRASRIYRLFRLVCGEGQRAGEVRRPPSLRSDQPGR